MENSIADMQDLVRYMDVHIQEKKHGLFTSQRRLTSNFMYAVFQVILEMQDADIDDEEDKPKKRKSLFVFSLFQR